LIDLGRAATATFKLIRPFNWVSLTCVAQAQDA